MDTNQRNRGSNPQRRAQAQNRPRAAAPAPGRSAPSQKRSSPRRKNSRQQATAPTSRRELESKLRRQNPSVGSPSRRVKKPRRPAQPVVYTQPKVFNRNRLLLKLLIVCSVVLALVLGMSIFFKVGTIKVSGAHAYTEWDIKEASGIKAGDNLLSFSQARASGQIQAKLPYVNKVRIGIKLPDTVIIYVEEIDVAYAVQCDSGAWWLMTSQGRIVEQISQTDSEEYTKVVGIKLSSPVVNEQAVAVEEAAAASDPTAVTDPNAATPVTVTGAQRLSAAKTILAALEANGIVGEAAQVDVTNLNSIELAYGTRFDVMLGDSQNLEYKIAFMKKAIAQLGEYETGILDVSFTTWEDQAGFTPYAS